MLSSFSPARGTGTKLSWREKNTTRVMSFSFLRPDPKTLKSFKLRLVAYQLFFRLMELVRNVCHCWDIVSSQLFDQLGDSRWSSPPCCKSNRSKCKKISHIVLIVHLCAGWFQPAGLSPWNTYHNVGQRFVESR